MTTFGIISIVTLAIIDSIMAMVCIAISVSSKYMNDTK